MVIAATDCPAASSPSPSRNCRQRFNREAANSWTTPAPATLPTNEDGTVRYDVTCELSEHRAIAMVYASNLRRCSPYWFPLAIHPLMLSCPKCRRHTPWPYFEGTTCADCRSNAIHDNRVAWLWFEENHRYLGWWQRGLAWYATRPRLFPNVWRFEDEYTEEDCELSATAAAQEHMRFYGKPPTETNLAEDVTSLHAEIQHYRETGNLAEPVEVSTVQAQYTHNAGAN